MRAASNGRPSPSIAGRSAGVGVLSVVQVDNAKRCSLAVSELGLCATRPLLFVLIVVPTWLAGSTLNCSFGRRQERC